MSLPKSWLVSRDGVGLERLVERVGLEDVDAHRHQRDVRRAGHADRFARLLLEAGDGVAGVDGDDAEARRFGHRHFEAGDRRRGAALLMEAQHPRVVHLVDVVAGQHDDVPRVLARDRVEVLVDGVGGAEVPVLADALLRRQDLDEVAELFREHLPAHADVPRQRERLVLGGDVDAAEAGVHAVGEREIDDPVRAAEVDGGLGPLLGQREQALADASGQDNHQRIGRHTARMIPRGRAVPGPQLPRCQ